MPLMGSNCDQSMIRVGMAGDGVQRGQLNGKILADVLAIGSGDERRGEQRRRGAGIGGAVGRVGADDSNGQRLDRGVEHSVAGPNAGLARPPRILPRTVRTSASRPSRCAARNRDCPAGARVRGTPGSLGNRMPAGAPGKTTRLLARLEGGNLIVFLVPGLDAIPAQAVVQRQVLSDAPAILRVEAGIFVASIERLQLALVVLAGNAQQEIGEVDAGFASEEDEIAVQLGDGIGVHLIVVELAADI